KLVDEIAARGMQFQDLEAGLTRAACRLAEGIYDRGDQRFVHLAQRGLAVAKRNCRRAEHLPRTIRLGQRLRSLPRSRDRSLASGVGDLNRGHGSLRTNESGYAC